MNRNERTACRTPRVRRVGMRRLEEFFLFPSLGTTEYEIRCINTRSPRCLPSPPCTLSLCPRSRTRGACRHVVDWDRRVLALRECKENWYRDISRRLPPLSADCAFVVVYLWGYYQRPATQDRGGCAGHSTLRRCSVMLSSTLLSFCDGPRCSKSIGSLLGSVEVSMGLFAILDEMEINYW